MRSDRLAHRILALVVPGDRAAAIAGDLIESADTRGPRWYWLSLIRVVVAVLCQDAMRTPIHMAAFAAGTWLLYMVVTFVTMAIGVFASVILWGAAYVFANHTGVELLTTWLGVRVGLGPPAEAVWFVQVLMLAAVAPFQTGRLAARWWPGRELTVALVMSIVWPVMSLVAPLTVSRGVAASAQLVPVIVTCMFLGAVWVRLRTTPLDPQNG